eukprot:2261921-Amphidinium_carterae.1
MEGFHNSGLHVRWLAKRTHPGHRLACQRTHPGHRLFKSAKALPLHKVSPGGPLSINPKVTSSDPHWGQETGTPGSL